MIRILICEDVRLLRAGLVALLSRPANIEVVAQLHSSDRIVPVAIVTRPDVAVIDIDMPGSTVALTLLHDAIPRCRTLALSDRGNPGHVRRSITVNAHGFMLKTASPDLMLTAISRVARGERIVDPSLTHRASNSTESPLTPREADVLRVAAEGLSAAEIATRLSLSPGTVRNYISRAITKTGGRNRLDAIRIADEEGWLLMPAQWER